MVVEDLREDLRVAWPEAFCIIALQVQRLVQGAKEMETGDELVNNSNDRRN